MTDDLQHSALSLIFGERRHVDDVLGAIPAGRHFESLHHGSLKSPGFSPSAFALSRRVFFVTLVKSL